METYPIALSPGDGVGGELTAQVQKLFSALERKYPVRFELVPFSSCGPAIDLYGTALRPEDRELALSCRAVLFGNIGDAARVSPAPEQTPVYALTAMRKAFRVCTNIRPVRILPATAKLSPLKEAIIAQGMDILLVRDLMGGMIAGERRRGHGRGGEEASDLEFYTEDIVRYSAGFAFREAQRRRRKLTSVDKANVLYSGKLWRETVIETAHDFPEVSLSHYYVDYAAMDLLIHPSGYDVVLASNVFGDILADEIAQISGTPWLFGSAELAADGRGVYTPNQLHHPMGTEWAGKGIISPYGILDAVSLLLRYSCGRPDLSEAVDGAVRSCLEAGLFTGEALPEGGRCLSTDELGDAVADRIR